MSSGSLYMHSSNSARTRRYIEGLGQRTPSLDNESIGMASSRSR